MKSSDLKLEPIIKGDLLLIMSWRNHPDVQPGLRSSLPTTPDGQLKWFHSLDRNSELYFIMICAGERVGYCGLDKIHWQNSNAEVALLVAPGSQNKGYGRHAIELLLRLAFYKLNLHLIYGEVYDKNKLEFWKNFGFQVEGEMRERHFQNNNYYDAYMISISKLEFNNP